ncbi:hypothetical protein MFLO_03143 [Listeria floridensis FSL S10-1187]|uniref:Uncharacterized protein n=1 Tax=Listeria floridensis FSL S10-1187 TaxID=1265817 RepID=A0ABP3B0U3_9LIST|nr:DUF3116 family protein [Listeria floridensis]EUJ33505.1 hypothetical protein MFLO_03143 [Listeria floridensis FSL S10-1187]
MNEPSNNLKLITLEYVYDPEFYFVNFQETKFDTDSRLNENHPTRNELLYTMYWLEWKGFVLRKQPYMDTKKTYFITDKGKLLYQQLKKSEHL